METARRRLERQINLLCFALHSPLKAWAPCARCADVTRPKRGRHAR